MEKKNDVPGKFNAVLASLSEKIWLKRVGSDEIHEGLNLMLAGLLVAERHASLNQDREVELLCFQFFTHTGPFVGTIAGDYEEGGVFSH